MSRTVNGTTTEYYWSDGTLLAQKTGENTLVFLYDDKGTPFGFRYNGATYYYTFNAQGDVTGILDNTGNTVARYTYDEWGSPLTITDATGADVSGNSSHIANINPLRYRAYYFDAESGLYYISSRYYDPEVGRWINADSVISGIGESIQSYNMFSYCFNNPVNTADDSGNWPKWIEDAANWVNEKIVQPVKEFVADVVEDVKNFDINNQSEKKALDSNYFSAYKGVPVVRIGGNRSGSFGAIFLTKETNNRSNPEDVVRHEYGHTKQLQQLGVVKYAIDIGIPSALEIGGGDYYSRPWEITADIYGGVQSRHHATEDIKAGFSYLERSKSGGPFVWIFMD